MSRSHDEIRPPYARESNVYPRRTAFFGSVNNVRFLADDTSNRRFWPIEVTAVDYQHDIDMQQVWAEAMHQVEENETWWLTPDENQVVGEHNEAFRSVDRVEEMILQAYDCDALPSRHLSASQVLAEIGVVGAKVGEMRKAAVILEKLFASSKRRGVKTYHMPYLLTERRHLTPVRANYADGPL